MARDPARGDRTRQTTTRRERYAPELETPLWAPETGIERAQVECLIAVERVPCSLEEPSSGDEGGRGDTFGERLPDPVAEEAYERAAGRLTSVLLRIASLSRREQTMLRGRYGLDGPVQTLRGLGADLGMSAEHVRQLEQQALDTLPAAATQAPTSS